MAIAVPNVKEVKAAPSKPAPQSSAVVWISGRRALLARTERRGGVSTWAIDRGTDGLEPESNYLAAVVDAIGDRERVMILGPGPERLALEREYVAIYQRPDRLVDVEPAGSVNEAALVDRLRQLAAA